MRVIVLTAATLAVALGAARVEPVQPVRLVPDEIAAKAAHSAGAGTSGIRGIRTTILEGDPSKPGLYTIRLDIPPNTTIAAHTHRDDRAAVVISGTWYFGYGRVATAAAVRPLTMGSFYTEPAGVAHFAMTKSEPVVVSITGYGPTDTVYIDPADDPRHK